MAREKEVEVKARCVEIAEKKTLDQAKIIEVEQKSLDEKRNQLFKSYDALTERIYLFERECERLKLQKR